MANSKRPPHEASAPPMPGAWWCRARQGLALGAAAVCAVVLVAVAAAPSSVELEHSGVFMAAAGSHRVAPASASHLRRDLQEQISAEVRDVLQHAQGALCSSPSALSAPFARPCALSLALAPTGARARSPSTPPDSSLSSPPCEPQRGGLCFPSTCCRSKCWRSTT
jgi:hypothetical protein